MLSYKYAGIEVQHFKLTALQHCQSWWFMHLRKLWTQCLFVCLPGAAPGFWLKHTEGNFEYCLNLARLALLYILWWKPAFEKKKKTSMSSHAVCRSHSNMMHKLHILCYRELQVGKLFGALWRKLPVSETSLNNSLSGLDIIICFTLHITLSSCHFSIQHLIVESLTPLWMWTLQCTLVKDITTVYCKVLKLTTHCS